MEPQVLIAAGVALVIAYLVIKRLQRKKEPYVTLTTPNNWLNKYDQSRSVGAETLYGEDTRDSYTRALDNAKRVTVHGDLSLGQPLVSSSGVVHTTSDQVLPMWDSPSADGHLSPIYLDARNGQFRYLTTSQRGDSTGLGMKKMRHHDLDTEEILEFARMQQEAEAMSLYGDAAHDNVNPRSFQ